MRGAGKSTWAKGALPAARRIDLVDEGLYQSYLREPALFANELRTIPRGTTVGQLLRAYGEPVSGTGHPFDGLWYWAPSEGQIEVDFLIKAGTGFVAVEAKAKTVLNSKDFAGLRAIQGLAGVKRRLVVYLGDRPQRTEDGIDVLPLRGFLAALEQHWLW